MLGAIIFTVLPSPENQPGVLADQVQIAAEHVDSVKNPLDPAWAARHNMHFCSNAMKHRNLQIELACGGDLPSTGPEEESN